MQFSYCFLLKSLWIRIWKGCIVYFKVNARDLLLTFMLFWCLTHSFRILNQIPLLQKFWLDRKMSLSIVRSTILSTVCLWVRNDICKSSVIRLIHLDNNIYLHLAMFLYHNFFYISLALYSRAIFFHCFLLSSLLFKSANDSESGVVVDSACIWTTMKLLI